MGPGALSNLLAALRLPGSPALLVGLEASDDAAVYQLDERRALVQTVDFFPPIVDDPYNYGAIAATNALSDIYAMGGRPVLALAIAAFPEDLDPAVMAAILQGGADKVAEAGAVVAGGHTVVDREPKYGLCVTGLVDPARVTTTGGTRPGDRLLLTKPLGTGLITTAAKRDAADPEHLAAATASMLRLNRRAAELAVDLGVHAATDITGFGLLGHAAEVARYSGVSLMIEAARLPVLPGALAYAEAGIAAGGLGRNRHFLEHDGFVQFDEGVSEARRLLCFDPQTSGGLLIALPPAAADELLRRCDAEGEPCWPIGDVREGAGIHVG
ncbi:MAG: selenide, water dikinase SelD [Chloroflexi bacterium OHK40]